MSMLPLRIMPGQCIAHARMATESADPPPFGARIFAVSVAAGRIATIRLVALKDCMDTMPPLVVPDAEVGHTIDRRSVRCRRGIFRDGRR